MATGSTIKRIRELFEAGWMDRGLAVLTGGFKGQIFTKNSDEDFDTRWIDPTIVPGDPIIFWPIGSVFVTVANINPVTLLGIGIWVEVSHPQGLLKVYMWERTA